MTVGVGRYRDAPGVGWVAVGCERCGESALSVILPGDVRELGACP